MAAARQIVKKVHWVGSSKKELKSFPEPVMKDMGVALHIAQLGGKAPTAKPLKGLGSGVVEIAVGYRGAAYRTVYAVGFAGVIYVLHAFQKKSKSGIKTPRTDMDKVKERLKRAEQDYLEEKARHEHEEKTT